MADIKKITLPSGTTYNIVDQGARELIAGLSGSTQYLGVTTTELVDNVTTSPTIIVSGSAVTASAGGIATYGSKEFIYSGTVWQEFGDLSALGALAYKNSATGSITPSGTVSQPTFTGTSTTSTGNFTPSGSVAIASESTGTSNYTPAGTISTPEITITPTTDTVNSITDVGSLPSFTATVSNETLSLGWSAGALPTKGANQTVMTDASASSTRPTFTGTGAVLSATFTGTEGNVSVSGTPSGTVSQPTFTGTSGTVTVS